jgi:hypothetical protein
VIPPTETAITEATAISPTRKASIRKSVRPAESWTKAAAAKTCAGGAKAMAPKTMTAKTSPAEAVTATTVTPAAAMG